MSKQRRNKRRTNERKKAQAAVAAKPERRSFLAIIRNAAIAGVVVAGGAYYGVGAVQATVAEMDLSRIGVGVPTIVQIHDPSCPRCRSLQKQTRRALKSFDEEDVVFLVADINTNDGLALASKHNVGHVTLLFFDEKGELRKTLHGTQTRGFLHDEIKAHLQD